MFTETAEAAYPSEQANKPQSSESTHNKKRASDKLKNIGRNQVRKILTNLAKEGAVLGENIFLEKTKKMQEGASVDAQKIQESAEKDGGINRLLANMADRYGSISSTFNTEGGVFTPEGEGRQRAMQELAKFMNIPIGEPNGEAKFPNGITTNDVLTKIRGVAEATRDASFANKYREANDDGTVNYEGLAPWALGGMQKTLREMAKSSHSSEGKKDIKKAKADLLQIRQSLGATGPQRFWKVAPFLAQKAEGALIHGARVGKRVSEAKGIKAGVKMGAAAAGRDLVRSKPITTIEGKK